LKLVPLAPAEQIELGLLRSELYADNASVAEGWTRVRDAAGVLLAGKPVRLVAGERFEDVNGDGVFTAGTDRLLDDLDGNGQWSAIGTLESIVITDAAGRAGFTYVAGTTTGRVWVRGSVDGVSAETSIDLETPPPVATIRFAPTFERMTVTGGGGATSNLLVAECLSATGDPVQAGTQVSFRITSSPGGGEALAGAVGGIVDAPTDDDGKAGATLLSGTRSGWVQVRASVGSFYQDVGIFIDPGPAARLTCLADSVSLVSGSYCWVRAWLYDAQNNPVRDGTPVHFEVDEGLIVPDQGGLTEDGEALAIYTAATPVSTGDGHAVITISGDGDNNGVVTCQSVILVPAPTGSICRILVEASAGEIGVRGTGAPEQVTLLARAYDCNENPARAGQRVGFRIIEGPGGGEYLSGCLCDTTSALTDELGIARATLNSGTKSGTVLVQAEVSGAAGISAHTPIAIAAGPPAYISIGVNQCNVLAEGYVNYENDVVALVYDTYRNPVRDRTAVWFTTDIGMVEGEDGGGLGSALTLRGVATGTWHGAGDGGIVTVFASTHGSEVLEASTTFIGSGDPYSSTFLLPTQSPVSVYADGRSEILMRVEVLDVNGLFVLPVDVEFRATYGDVPQSVRTEDGCHASYAEGDYRALTLERDDSYTVPDDGIGANDVVTASGGFGPYGDSFQVRLLTGNAAASRSAIDLETLPPSAQSYFTVTVKDGWGNPLGGHALALTATQGTVTSEGLTDSYGIAGGLSFIAPDSTGTVYVEVRDLDPNHGGNMILRKSISITQ
jgi:hypothetical protein